MKSQYVIAFVFGSLMLNTTGCVIEDLPGINSLPTGLDNDDTGSTDDDQSGITDESGANAGSDDSAFGQPVDNTPPPVTPTPAPEPVVCPDDASVSMSVQIHTFLVAGHPNGFAVDGTFTWNASGDVTVRLQFKTNGGDWINLASGLPKADVKTIDLSQYAGAGQSHWHFRAVADAPGCSDFAAASDITTIQNF